jgi:hypothetical protein
MSDIVERVWERGWDGHQHAQARRLARLPLSQKLQWLEEAQELVHQLTRSSQTIAPADAAPRQRSDAD